jgi:hypothetical protein
MKSQLSICNQHDHHLKYVFNFRISLFICSALISCWNFTFSACSSTYLCQSSPVVDADSQDQSHSPKSPYVSQYSSTADETWYAILLSLLGHCPSQHAAYWLPEN